MTPAELNAESFRSYPPQARKIASDRVALLRVLPVAFVPFLLKEIVSYDWKFPAERSELDRQFAFLEILSKDERQRHMAVFAGLRLSPQLEGFDWVNAPAQFLEQLSAHLWATHQMDAFRAASEAYVRKVYDEHAPEPPTIPRWGIAVIGQNVAENRYKLFRKLRREGVYFRNVNPESGLQAILEAVRTRAAAHPVLYGHWYIDGGSTVPCDGATCVSYQALTPARAALAAKMRRVFESPNFGAEALRTMLARMGPEELGMKNAGADPLLDRFQISLLTEGSGTQIFSTTFVQWAAREALRRAQPLTLLARFAPRQREKPMNELLDGNSKPVETDPLGSLIDADMGAYYTWVNQQRLSGAEQSRFLVWFENHGEAVAIAPSLPRGTEDATSIDLPRLLRKLS